jgi:hypothetical protein
MNIDIDFVEEWYVVADPYELKFAEKMAAEIWARKLWPLMDPHKRYARIYSTQRQKTLITEQQAKELTA